MGDLIYNLKDLALVPGRVSELPSSIVSASIDQSRQGQHQGVVVTTSHLLGTVREVGNLYGRDGIGGWHVCLTKAELASRVGSTDEDPPGHVNETAVLKATVDLDDPRVPRDLDLCRSELVLQGAKTKRAKLALSPAEDPAFFRADPGLVATAGNRLDVPQVEGLDQNWRVLEPYRVIDTQLSMLI